MKLREITNTSGAFLEGVALRAAKVGIGFDGGAFLAANVVIGLDGGALRDAIVGRGGGIGRLGSTLGGSGFSGGLKQELRVMHYCTVITFIHLVYIPNLHLIIFICIMLRKFL